MASSTSLSNRRFCRRAVALAGVAVLAWALGAAYTLWWNPEIQFYKHGALVKQAYARWLEARYPHKVVVAGGSSCATSVDGARMLERDGVPLLNMGMAAGMGSRMLTRLAMNELREGDTLVVALEPPLLGGSTELPDLAVQLSLAAGLPSLLPERAPLPWLKSLLDLRPGAYHTLTLLGKLAVHRPLFAYQPRDFHTSGWHETAMNGDFPNPKIEPAHLSPEGRAWLVYVRDWCARHQVRVAYTLPWYYCPPADAPRLRAVHATFIREVAGVIPVFHDAHLGVHPVREHYANTSLHPNPLGAALHTDELAREIKAWDLWSVKELEADRSGWLPDSERK